MGRVRPVSTEIRAYIKFRKGSKADDLIKETGVSSSHIYKIWASSFNSETKKEPVQKQTRKRGGPEKLSRRDKRRILRLVGTLRRQNANWTVKRLMARADLLDGRVARRTVSHFLNKNGYFYLQARKKGLLSEADKQKRVRFARNMLQFYPEDVWTQKIAFYLDGVGFVYKRNPRDQAMPPAGRVWRMKKEGLLQGCTAKGQACGTGGKYVKMIVAISYDKGVIICQRYEKMTGNYFAGFLEEHFENMVIEAGKGSRMWIQDGDPSQNSTASREAMTRVNSVLLPIPPRSPDMNPIKNFFGIVKARLKMDAIERNIEVETMDEFENRIRCIMKDIPLKTTNSIIESMNKRMKLIIENRGERLKY